MIMPKYVAKGLDRYRFLLIPLAFLVLNAAVWTVFAVSGGNPNLHGDSFEAYVWGREFQWGYYKHPPFWAWIAGLWFSVFPHKDWAFYFLSELNASLGIVGTWALLGRFVKGPQRLAGTLLLLLTTFYTFNALRFNANTILLSLWPWTMYFYVRSLEDRTALSGIPFGLVAAAAVLSKYYSLLLLFACFVALFVHPKKWKYVKSPAPWVAALVFALAVLPHLVWVVRSDFLPFVYALMQEGAPKPKFVNTRIGFVLACLAFHALQLIVILAAFKWKTYRKKSKLHTQLMHYMPFLTVMGVTPFLVTLLIGLGGFRVTTCYVIPIFSLTPFLAMIYLRADAKKVSKICAWCYGVMAVGCLVAAPFVQSIPSVGKLQPRSELYGAAFEEWSKVTDRPLRIVAGTQPFSEALTFYAPGDVSEFIDLNETYSPWITKSRIAEQGMLVLCRTMWCIDLVAPFRTPETVVVKRKITPTFRSYKGKEFEFTFFIVPPAGGAKPL